MAALLNTLTCSSTAECGAGQYVHAAIFRCHETSSLVQLVECLLRRAWQSFRVLIYSLLDNEHIPALLSEFTGHDSATCSRPNDEHVRIERFKRRERVREVIGVMRAHTSCVFSSMRVSEGREASGKGEIREIGVGYVQLDSCRGHV